MKKEVIPIKFQERDYEILKYIGLNQVMSTDQIYTIFFKTDKDCKSGCYRRLSLLRKEGYIKDNKTFTEGAIFYLTGDGKKLVEDTFAISVKQKKGFTTIRHDLMKTDLFIYLSKYEKISQYEVEFKIENRLQPDSKFYIYSNKHQTWIPYFVEIDNKGMIRDFISKITSYDAIATEREYLKYGFNAMPRIAVVTNKKKEIIDCILKNRKTQNNYYILDYADIKAAAGPKWVIAGKDELNSLVN